MSTTNIYDIAATWNNVATTFAGIKLNVTDTASASGSLLLDLQVGGSSKFRVRKDGYATVASGIYVPSGSVQIQDTSVLSNAIRMGESVQVLSREPIESLTGPVLGSTDSVLRLRVASVALLHLTANTIEQRNGTNAQAFNIYNAYNDASNYERGCVKWVSNRFEIGTEAAGTGVARPHRFYLHSNQESWIEDTNASGGGYRVAIRNRYGNEFQFGTTLFSPGAIVLGHISHGPSVHWGARSSRPTGALNANVSAGDLHLCGKYGGPYSSGLGYHHGTGIAAWCGYGSTPTDINGNGGDAGNFDVWLNSGGVGNGSGDAGASGRFRIIDDDVDSEVFAIDKSGNIYLTPSSSVDLTSASNGTLTFEATNNTTLTFKLKGSDGTVRSGTVSLS